VRIVCDPEGRATGVEFARTRAADPTHRDGPLHVVPGTNFVIEADMVVKALGQAPLLDLLKSLPELRLDGSKVWVDRSTGATSVPRLFAGGDCIRGGGEIVDAVQDGKIAAWGIHSLIMGSRRFIDA
jgi:glutamate synthase (NADPH/NADH) small chain